MWQIKLWMGRAALYDQIFKIKGQELVMTQLRGRKGEPDGSTPPIYDFSVTNS